MPRYDFEIRELARWQRYESDGLRITAVPVRHSGFRYVLDDAWMGENGFSGYVIEHHGSGWQRCGVLLSPCAGSDHCQNQTPNFIPPDRRGLPTSLARSLRPRLCSQSQHQKLCPILKKKLKWLACPTCGLGTWEEVV